MLEVDLKERLVNIRERIKAAAGRAGREASEIKLIAVSKNHSIDKILALKKLGINLFGESRVQELREKNERLTGITWHFIGHLQRNKVKYLMRMENCQLIHSLDSWRLAREINKWARKNKRVMPVLLEVNVSGDENKFGLKPEDTLAFVEETQSLKFVDLQGLMTIAPYVKDPEEVRPCFRQLVELREEIAAKGYQLKELSMGMTNDFEVAIEEGATMVRIGTGLFGKRDE